MLKLECENGAAKVGINTKYGLAGIALDLTYCIKGLINTIDDPEDKEILKGFVERYLGRIAVSDDPEKITDILMNDLMDDLMERWFKDEVKHK